MLELRPHVASFHLCAYQLADHRVAHRDDGFVAELLLHRVREAIDEYILAHRAFVIAAPYYIHALAVHRYRFAFYRDEVLGNKHIVAPFVELRARVFICIRAVETDLASHLLAYEPLTNRFTVVLPIRHKLLIAWRLDADERLRLGPYVT